MMTATESGPASGGAVFTGVAVALATLFDDSEDVDAAASARHARRLVAEGVTAVVVCGTSGEADALTDDERLALLDAVQDEIGSDVPVVMGVGLPSSRQTIELTERVVQRSVAAVLARSPRGTVDCSGYYRTLANATGATPLLAYHFPAVAPPGIPIEELVLQGLIV